MPVAGVQVAAERQIRARMTSVAAPSGDEKVAEQQEREYKPGEGRGRPGRGTATTASSYRSFANYLVGRQCTQDHIADNEMPCAYIASTGSGTTANSCNGDPKAPKNCYTIHQHYCGLHPEVATNRENIKEILADFSAVSALRIIAEADIIFNTEQAYHRFWWVMRAGLEHGQYDYLRHFHLKPLFRSKTCIITMNLHSAKVPRENITFCWARECQVLYGPRKYQNRHLGVWKGEFRFVISLDHDPTTKHLHHLPKYLFVGRRQPIIHYSS